MTQSQVNLGGVPSEGAYRDAVHVAVAPAMAGDTLNPGDKVKFDPIGFLVRCEPEEAVGAVDPFLGSPLAFGDSFWLFVMPNSVSGMRHEWKHPLFGPALTCDTPNRRASEAWLQDYAVRLRPYDRRDDVGEAPCSPRESYERMMSKILGDNQVLGWGSDLHGFGELQDGEAFLRHLSVVLGRSIQPDDLEYICSC